MGIPKVRWSNLLLTFEQHQLFSKYKLELKQNTRSSFIFYSKCCFKHSVTKTSIEMHVSHNVPLRTPAPQSRRYEGICIRVSVIFICDMCSPYPLLELKVQRLTIGSVPH